MITPVYKLPTLYETFWDWFNKVEMCDLESDEITEQIYSFQPGFTHVLTSAAAYRLLSLPEANLPISSKNVKTNFRQTPHGFLC